MSREVVVTVEQVRRSSTSRNGNPRYVVSMRKVDSGVPIEAQTVVDGSVGYQITNAEHASGTPSESG